jgi:hypothetical protein
MDIDVFPAREMATVFRTLRTALRSHGPLDATERSFLRTVSSITGHPVGEADPEPIAADAVAIHDPHAAKRLVQLSALAALLHRPVRRGSGTFLQALAQQLEVVDAVVELVEALEHGRTGKVRLIAMRRAFGSLLREAYQREGAVGIVRFFAALFFKVGVNKDKHRQYQHLGLLPEGTLGREYWKHMMERDFGFPGVRGGIPDAIAYHDVAHVLTGYDTDPAGEICQGSFQGGNRRDDGFFFIQFVILQFHQGFKITPAAPADTGMFDPSKVLWAVHRGANCNVDVTHQWDFWPLMPLPLEEVRERIGLLPVAG